MGCSRHEILAETLLERGAEGDLAEANRRSTGWRNCRQKKVR